MSNTNITHVPVLVIGAGAGGVVTSALLAKHGVHSLLVEKRREIFIYPKARNISFRSLEILRGLGVGDEVHAVAAGVSQLYVKPSLNSPEQEPALDIDAIFAPFEGLSPEPPGQYCPQSRLEPILLAETRRYGNEVRYGTELRSLEEDATGLTAVVHDLDAQVSETVRADYVVAADGVHSRIRDTLGVATSGHGAIPVYVVFIYFRAPWRQFVPDLLDGDAIQVKNADVDAIFLVAKDDLGMMIMTYFPDKGESAAQFTPQRCRELILKAVGEPIDVQIIEVVAWQPYERVADQFQCGRVFFVGDSAHAMPPLKAGGANTAIQSAHNLAWKLAAVLHGSAGPGLLATYHAERHPIGRFSARQSLTGPTLKFLHFGDDVPALPPEEEAPMFALLAGYQYRSTAVIADPPTEPDTALYVDELRGQPGTRVPHVWLRRGDQPVSTLDLLGPGFTVLTGDGGAGWLDAAASASAALGIRIDAYRVGPHGDAIDADGQWAALTALRPDGALLVRPDDFVGWRADELPAEPDKALRETLSAILSR